MQINIMSIQIKTKSNRFRLKLKTKINNIAQFECDEEVVDETGCLRAIGFLNQYDQVKLG